MKTAIFDAVDYLDSDDAMVAYLAAALDDPNPDIFLAAVGDIARLKGMGDIAKATGLGRESLYKSFRAGSHIRFETVRKIMSALGMKLNVALSTREPA